MHARVRPGARTGDEDEGTVTVRAKPRIAEVRMPEASSACFSLGASLDRKSTRGWIMYEFHRKPASKLSIDTVAASEDLSCNRRVRSKSEL